MRRQNLSGASGGKLAIAGCEVFTPQRMAFGKTLIAKEGITKAPTNTA